MYKVLFILVVFLFLTYSVLAQSVIVGTIVDEKTNPLESANVYLKGTVIGAASASDGKFQITKVPHGDFILIISMIGFQLHEIDVRIESDTLDLGKIGLQMSALQSQPIVVTAARHEQSIQDLSASVANVSAEEIAYRNSITIDNALQYVSGLNMTGNQINIRGASGYSRGLGSRVLMLVDGIPYMTADTKGANFESLAANQIERIEIVKGAGSALYGSSAIGGVINVINKKIEVGSLFNFRIYGGFYSNTYYPEWEWSDQTRFLSGLKFDYSHKSGSIGYRIGASHDQDDSYKQNNWMKRYHLYAAFEWDISAFEELRLSGTYMDQKRADFLYWKNLANALVPPDDQIGNEVDARRWHIAGNYRHVLDKDRYYTIKAIWFRNHFDDNIESEEFTGGNKSLSDYWDAEFQYNFELGMHQMTLGVDANLSTVSSNVFSDKSGQNAALFAQDEIAVSENYIITPGIRVDYFDLEEVGKDYQINPKLGIVFKPGVTSAIRLSAGRGFRAPSIAEVFTNTTASGLRIVPNLELQPERSVSAEIGFNQFIGQKAFLDVAVFYNRFWNLIEGKFTGDAEIKFENVTNARSAGLEMNFSLHALSDRLFYQIGYTYSDARELPSEEFLTFRPRHLLYQQAHYTWNKILIGVDYRFISEWDKIDASFSIFIRDADERVPAHILDLRLAYFIEIAQSKFEISLQVNNLLQYHYLDLVGSIAPTRHYMLTLSGQL